MSETFKAIYDIDDGYVGSRPHSFKIDKNELEDVDNPIEFFLSAIQDHFEQNVAPYPKNLNEFVAWFNKNKPSDDDY